MANCTLHSNEYGVVGTCRTQLYCLRAFALSSFECKVQESGVK